MTRRTTQRSLASGRLLAVAAGLTLAAGLFYATPAWAGRGGSAAEIIANIQANSIDGIIGSIERAEYLLCNACIQPITALLDHDNPKAREVAAWWLRKRPAKADLVAQMTARLASGGDPILARNAADALGNFKDPAALPVLGRVATDPSQPVIVRRAAVAALGTIGHPEGAVALKMALSDTDATVRRQAVNSLRLVRGYTDASPLMPLFNDPDVGVRRATILYAGVLKSPDTVPSLIAVLSSDADARARRQAAWALGAIGDRTAFQALASAVQSDPDTFVQAMARSALRMLR